MPTMGKSAMPCPPRRAAQRFASRQFSEPPSLFRAAFPIQYDLLRDGRATLARPGARRVRAPTRRTPRRGVREPVPCCGLRGSVWLSAPDLGWRYEGGFVAGRPAASGVAAVCAQRALASAPSATRPRARGRRAASRGVRSDRRAALPAAARCPPLRTVAPCQAPCGDGANPADVPPRGVCEGSPRAMPDRRQRIATTTATAAAETPAAINPARGMVRGSARFAIARTRSAAVPADIVRP